MSRARMDFLAFLGISWQSDIRCVSDFCRMRMVILAFLGFVCVCVLNFFFNLAKKF